VERDILKAAATIELELQSKLSSVWHSDAVDGNWQLQPRMQCLETQSHQLEQRVRDAGGEMARTREGALSRR
jgi:hypothetical protein